MAGALKPGAGPGGTARRCSHWPWCRCRRRRPGRWGELSHKSGTAGCVSETGTGGACQDGTALEDAVGVAPSPDGKNLYVASLDSGAVRVFDRTRRAGR
jgi:DNA-binding beta-propeller fold protein YncE